MLQMLPLVILVLSSDSDEHFRCDICDFGSSAPYDHSLHHFGTRSYCPPEAYFSHQVNTLAAKRIDVFSLGITLLRLAVTTVMIRVYFDSLLWFDKTFHRFQTDLINYSRLGQKLCHNSFAHLIIQ